MIISEMFGGTGNQLFQYAFGRMLAEKNNTELKLDTVRFARQVFAPQPVGLTVNDTQATPAATPSALKQTLAKFKRAFYSPVHWNHYHNDGMREYKMYHFNVKATPLSKWDLLKLNFDVRVLHKYTVIDREMSTKGFEPELLDLKGDLYLFGFWQSEKYFKEIAPAIRAELKVVTPPDERNQELLNLISAVEAVSLHVRRGDYVADPNVNKNFGTCTPEYYAQAIHHIKKNVAHPHFFVFSDDPEWAEANIKPDAPVTYVQGSANPQDYDYEDLRLMYSCKHFIIANSSFSWWGAWLSDNTSKIVIGPKRWFARSDVDTSDILPDNWIKL